MTPPPLEHANELDLSVLDQLVGNNAAKFRKFASLFLSTMEDVLQQIDVACVKDDVATLAAMGHRAKATAMSVGAKGLSCQFMLLEQSGKARDTTAAIVIAHSLRPMFQNVRSAIETRLAQ